MKSNIRAKVLIAIVFLLVIAALIAAFFLNRRGDGEVHSAYDYTVKTTVSATKQTTKKTTKKADAKESDKKDSEKQTTTTTLKPGTKRIVVPGTYVTILNKYQDALQARSGTQALLQKGLSPLLAEMYEGKPQENVGFWIDDFNGDGSMDLMIGVVEGYSHFPLAILDYYTLDNNGDAYNVFQSQPEDYFCACTNTRFLEKATDHNVYTAWYLYGLNSNGMALTFREGLIRDKDANKKKPWFKADDMDGDVANDKHVKNDVGKARQKQLDNARVQLKFTAFSKYNRANKAK